MRQLLVAFVAAAALFASQNSAEAVFEKVIIDDFTDPLAQNHSGTPGTPNSWDTRASGLTSGNVQTISTGTDVAEDRGLSAANPPTIVAGNNLLGITYVNPNAQAGIDWDVNGYDFVNELSIVIAGITSSLPFNSMVAVTLWQDDVAVDSTNVSFAPGQTRDILLTAVAGPTTYMGLTFQNLTNNDGLFLANYSIDKVVANPEPATMALMGLGVLGGAMGYRRRRKDDEVAPVEA
jgi:hypothetical protein